MFIFALFCSAFKTNVLLLFFFCFSLSCTLCAMIGPSYCDRFFFSSLSAVLSNVFTQTRRFHHLNYNLEISLIINQRFAIACIYYHHYYLLDKFLFWSIILLFFFFFDNLRIGLAVRFRSVCTTHLQLWFSPQIQMYTQCVLSGNKEWSIKRKINHTPNWKEK